MNKCLQCKKLTSNPKFCCRSCAAKYNNTKYPKRRPEGKCKKCQQPISTTRKYCDNCWGVNTRSEISQKSRPYIFSKRKSRKQFFCKRCNKQAGYRNKFCSQQCANLFRFEQRIAQIEQNGYIYPVSKHNTSASVARRYIIYKHSEQCSVCGLKPEWNNKPLKLVLDHINGIPNDWSIHNLRLVCPNCDSQLPTYKNKNKGNGRPRK
jgi:hypothetical protein